MITVKFITDSPLVSLPSPPPSPSLSSTRFFLEPGASTAVSHQAVFLSIFLDSADESVMILASSFANSASASSEGPGCSCVESTTTVSGEGARSSACRKVFLWLSSWHVAKNAYSRFLASCIVIFFVICLWPFPILTIITTVTLGCHFDACSVKKERFAGIAYIQHFASQY